jgi:pimeloyl-ACP methyl ester carboxylesterase
LQTAAAHRRYHREPVGKRLDDAIAVLNGAIGDYLVRRGNGLATELTLVCEDAPLPLERAALARAHPRASSKVVLLVHGLMNTEHAFDLEGGDYGQRLERDLGVSPLYLRYNSGLPIADNGAALGALLERLVDAWPVPLEELILVGYSMGGLVARSACHTGSLSGQRWLRLVRRAVYVGTPHRGAPMERGGRVLARVLAAIPDPYVRLVGEIAELRSEGVKDLGDAELRHEDRARRVRGWALTDPQHPVPLLPSIRHCLIAGAISADPWLAALFGDAVVPLASATDHGQGELQLETALLPVVSILHGLDHLQIAHDPRVYERVRAFLEEGAGEGAPA